MADVDERDGRSEIRAVTTNGDGDFLVAVENSKAIQPVNNSNSDRPCRPTVRGAQRPHTRCPDDKRAVLEHLDDFADGNGLIGHESTVDDEKPPRAALALAIEIAAPNRRANVEAPAASRAVTTASSGAPAGATLSRSGSSRRMKS